MEVKQRIQQLLQALNNGVYEKEEVMALSLLSAVAGESIFLLGAPGVAKSLIARRLKYAFKNGKSFEYLMNRFSTPDEIFGPVSISKLKDKDKYERIITNYLPDATIVFLDEIWKAGPSIQNVLLTVLNEKIYRNGEQEIKVPMKALISASNELPGKGEGLEALWDRFLIRLVVESIRETKNFNAMIEMPNPTKEFQIEDNLQITDKEYTDWSNAIDKIKIPDNVFNVIEVIRKKLQLHNEKEGNKENQIYVSDRRWRKIVRLLRTSAFLNDRKEVDLTDCFLIKECLWNETEQKGTVSQFVSDAIEEYGYKLQVDFKSLEEELDEFKEEIDQETSYIKPVKCTKHKVYTIQNKEYYRVLIKGAFDYDVDDLIEKNIVDSLKKSDNYIETRRWREDMKDKDPVWIKKSNDMYKIFLSDAQYHDGVEYSIECIFEDKNKKFSKKLHPKMEEYLDYRTATFIEITTNQKTELDNYRNKDLEHLKTNLFVNPALANIVESHLTATQKKIEKYEVEIHKIQNDYKKLKDEEIVVKEEENKK
jgi:MoxR-like ATPase